MDNCIFCKIVKGEIPCYKIAENEKYLAFLDISHFTEGHTLVIPKQHFQFVWDVDDPEGYFSFISKLANHFRKLGFQYIDSATFGRDVPHAHYHLIPHNDNNPEWKDSLEKIGGMQKDTSRRLTKEDGDRLAAKYRME